MQEKQLKLKNIIGYSVGACGDYAAYGFIFSFLSFFLTTVAGISPVMSGVIISTALVWDAITDPICGIMMDISKSKHGKRRPLILASSIPLGASIAFLFMNVNASVGIKNVYYLIMVLVFWTSYTWFNIPYYSLGAVICKSDEERTKLAGIRQVFSFIGNFFCGTAVTFLVGKFLEKGMTNAGAWQVAGIFIGVVVFISILISWRTTRGSEPVDTEAEMPTFREMVKQIGVVMKNKPYLLLIASALCFNVFMALFDSNLLYYVVYNMGLTETAASGLYLATTITSIVTIPLFVKLALKWDKKLIYSLLLMFSGIIMVLAKFIGINSYMAVMAYKIIVAIGSSCYWMFIFNFVYDCIDFDDANTNIRKDGVHMSFYSFLLKLGGAIASLVMGILLQASGFDAALPVQDVSSLNMIESLFTIYPGIFIFLSGLAIYLSPLSKKVMAEISKKITGRE